MTSLTVFFRSLVLWVLWVKDPCRTKFLLNDLIAVTVGSSGSSSFYRNWKKYFYHHHIFLSYLYELPLRQLLTTKVNEVSMTRIKSTMHTAMWDRKGVIWANKDYQRNPFLTNGLVHVCYRSIDIYSFTWRSKVRIGINIKIAYIYRIRKISLLWRQPYF